MKMAENNAIVDRDSITTDVSFKIKASGKAFKILSDTLYTDKPKAILRELSCNAYDAHVAAGKKDVPFLVKLPTYSDPNLTIRDYGIGLSHSSLVTITTTYFESTKTESNDFVGALGLGSKSPFSYVDSYSIISYFDGVKRIYCAFIDSDDTPKITLLNGVVADADAPGAEVKEDNGERFVKVEGEWIKHGEATGEKTGDPNGLEIIIPVKHTDHSTFSAKARQVFQHFTVRPEVIPELTYLTDEEFLSGDGWDVYKNSTHYDRGPRIVAVQGNVAYPVSVESITFADHKIQSFVQQLDRASQYGNVGVVVIQFQIGDLDVTASREGLSYKKLTNDSLNKKFTEMSSAFTRKLQEQVDSSPTMWDAMKTYYEIRRSVMSFVGGSFTYKGEAIPDVVKADVSSFGNVRAKRHDRVTFGSPSKNIEVSPGWYSRHETVVIGDKKDVIRRIKHSSLNSKGVMLVTLDKTDTASVKAAADFLKDELKGFPVSLASELPDPPAITRSSSAKISATKATGNARYTRLRGGSFILGTAIEVDFKAGGVYVPYQNNNLMFNDTDAISSTLTSTIDMFVTLTSSTLPTFVVPYASDLETFKNAKNWKTMEQYFADLGKDKKIVDGLLATTNSGAAAKTAIGELVNNGSFSRALMQLQTSHADLVQFSADAKKYFNSRAYYYGSDTSRFDKIRELLKIDPSIKPAAIGEDLNARYDSFIAQYPMLHEFTKLHSYGVDTTAKVLQEYITLVDKLKKYES